MHRLQHFMVGLTNTSLDAGLIRYAAMVAKLGTAKEVHFVHVLPPSSNQDHDRVAAEMGAMVRTHGANVPAQVGVQCEVLAGPFVDQLLVYAADHEVDLLVVGHRRNHPGRWALARRLAMKAPCSVWLVPEGSPCLLQRILVPIDFSEPAADALRVATVMAHLNSHAECLALHVFFNEARVTYDDYEQVLRGEEEQAFRKFISPINCQGVEVTPLFAEGVNVAHTIHHIAQDQGADLVVMATRGRSRSAAILLGSVTEDTIIETQVPLLVVKHFGARLGVLQVLLDRKFRHKGGVQTD